MASGTLRTGYHVTFQAGIGTDWATYSYVIDPERFYFLSTDVALKLLEEAHNADWRCIIGLSRFGGLRCPSEVLSLKWQDIDWQQQN